MLSLFRKYQRYIYIVVTVVIIISFSFFGTYSTLGSNTWREQLAFKAVNGDEITRFDVDDLSHFLATDNSDKRQFGGAWGPNFLNDGVIRKDFLETGLAVELILAYSGDLKSELQKRSEKEKKYVLYSHPKAPFINVEQIWNYFAPDMKVYFNALRNAQDPTEQVAVNSRINLYLAEKQYPPSMIKKILRYQEQQFDWLAPDYDLDHRDLSLFGYHSLNDWFGPQFTAMVSQFIINAAILAEEKGYYVSKAEAMADLARNNQASYKENLNNPHLGVASPQEYFNEQLRWLNMDQARAVKIWQQVLLFRRYFQDAGHSALVDIMPFKKFNQFASETITADVYRLPATLRLSNDKTLQKLDVYLNAVGKTSAKDPLALPQEYLSVNEVSKTYPELVQKRYALEVAQVSQKTLQSRIGIKELWRWETEDQNWKALREKFPELGVKTGTNQEGRFEILEDLDPNTRSRVDAFAKNAIIQAHPEWIKQALADAQPKKMVARIRTEGKKVPFEGLDTKQKREAFMKLLDEAPLGEEPKAESPLFAYSADQQSYYRIRLLDRSKEPEILTFAEANEDDTLDHLRDKVLEKYYLANRDKKPKVYQEENNEWKPFKSVRELVAEDYFGKLWEKIEPIKQALAQDDPVYKSMGKDQLAALSFYPRLKQIKEEIEKDPAKAEQYIRLKMEEETDLNHLPQPASLADQWRIEKETVVVSRQDEAPLVDLEEAFAMSPQTWSKLKVPFNGDLVFYHVAEKGMKEDSEGLIVQQTREAQDLLSAAAQRVLMQNVLAELKAKNAISLAYLSTPAEGSGSTEIEFGSEE